MARRSSKAKFAQGLSKNIITPGQKTLNDTVTELQKRRTPATPTRSNQLVEVAAVRLDGDTQPRVAMDSALVELYATRMIAPSSKEDAVCDPEGVAFDPIQLIREDDALWLVDGFHRVAAAKLAGISHIQAVIEVGSQLDAKKRSLSANARHGARRTNADKIHTVSRALQDPEFVKLSDTYLAELCAVSRTFVTKQRIQLERDGVIAFQMTVFDKQGRSHDTQRDAPLPSSSKPDAKQPAPKPSSRKKDTTTARRQSVKAASKALPWTSASKLDAPTDTLVAFPHTKRQWTNLVELAERTISDTGRLIVLFPQNDQRILELADAIHTLNTAGFAPPQCVHIKQHQRSYLVWSRGAEPLSLSLDRPRDMFTSADVTIIGDPIDSLD